LTLPLSAHFQEPIKQPTNQPTNQSTNHPMKQLTNHTINHIRTSQTTNQSTKHHISLPPNQKYLLCFMSKYNVLACNICLSVSWLQEKNAGYLAVMQFTYTGKPDLFAIQNVALCVKCGI